MPNVHIYLHKITLMYECTLCISNGCHYLFNLFLDFLDLNSISVLCRLLRFDTLYRKWCNRFSSDMKWFFGFHTHSWNWRGFVTHADIIQQLCGFCVEWVSDKMRNQFHYPDLYHKDSLVFDFQAAQAPASRSVWALHALLGCYIRCKTCWGVSARWTQSSDSAKKKNKSSKEKLLSTHAYKFLWDFITVADIVLQQLYNIFTRGAILQAPTHCVEGNNLYIKLLKLLLLPLNALWLWKISFAMLSEPNETKPKRMERKNRRYIFIA